MRSRLASGFALLATLFVVTDASQRATNTAVGTATLARSSTGAALAVGQSARRLADRPSLIDRGVGEVSTTRARTAAATSSGRRGGRRLSGGPQPLPSSAPCTPRNQYAAAFAAGYERYGPSCVRTTYTFGPLPLRAGQSDSLVAPTAIDKPNADGFLVGFRADVIDENGATVPSDEVHLHHALFLSSAQPWPWPTPGGPYGNLVTNAPLGGPIGGGGAEKTDLVLPAGYGIPVKTTEQWALIAMIHNLTAASRVAWITYDIDFISQADGTRLGIAPLKLIWMDVHRKKIHPESPDGWPNPVFNVEQGFGHVDAELGQLVCTWPMENCARTDPLGRVSIQQGRTTDSAGRPVSIAGADHVVGPDEAGALVAAFGHVHPGGERVEIGLVRDHKQRDIFVSDAVYWDRSNRQRAGGPPTSWDLSMTGTSSTFGWKVRIQEGDVLRLNAFIDSAHASWYESMGMVGLLVAPANSTPGAVDVFSKGVEVDRGTPSTAIRPPGFGDGWAVQPGVCVPDLEGAVKRLCVRGQVTHGALRESERFGGCPGAQCDALPGGEGPLVSDISLSAFSYGLADLALAKSNGVPRINVGQTVRFWNVDAGLKVYHTITRCEEPCTGSPGMGYPLAKGTGSNDSAKRMYFDSGQIGYGIASDDARGQLLWDKSVGDSAQDGIVWQFTPERSGTYAFFCRTHPFMRGVIKVVED